MVSQESQIGACKVFCVSSSESKVWLRSPPEFFPHFYKGDLIKPQTPRWLSDLTKWSEAYKTIMSQSNLMFNDNITENLSQM
jgi:hypothetical protein